MPRFSILSVFLQSHLPHRTTGPHCSKVGSEQLWQASNKWLQIHWYEHLKWKKFSHEIRGKERKYAPVWPVRVKACFTALLFTTGRCRFNSISHVFAGILSHLAGSSTFTSSLPSLAVSTFQPLCAFKDISKQTFGKGGYKQTPSYKASSGWWLIYYSLLG